MNVQHFLYLYYMSLEHSESSFGPEIYEIAEDREQMSSKYQQFQQINCPQNCQPFKNVQFPREKDVKPTAAEKQENDNIKWNYNVMYPQIKEFGFSEEGCQFEQSFMEKHEVVLSRSLQDFCEKYHPLKFGNNLEDFFSVMSVRNTDTQVLSQIEDCQSLEQNQKNQIQQILYLDPDCYKIIDSTLAISPLNLREFTLNLCVHLIIEGKTLENVENHLNFKQQIKSRKQKLARDYFKIVIEEFQSENEECMFDDFCFFLERWMSTIFLASNGIFQNQIFEQLSQSEGRSKSLSQALSQIQKKVEKRKWKRRKNIGNITKKGKKKFIFKTRSKKR